MWNPRVLCGKNQQKMCGIQFGKDFGGKLTAREPIQKGPLTSAYQIPACLELKTEFN